MNRILKSQMDPFSDKTPGNTIRHPFGLKLCNLPFADVCLSESKVQFKAQNVKSFMRKEYFVIY